MAEKKKATYQTIADEVGVSKTTISLAFKGDSSIPESTRQKIYEVAARQGYKVDAHLSRLMSYLRNTRKSEKQAVIALVTDTAKPSPWKRNRYSALTHEGICKRAVELGYKVEEFWVHADNISGKRLEQILYARGIEGILLTALIHRRLDIDFSRFAVVSIGRTIKHPITHTSETDHFNGILDYCKLLQKKGYKRIGLFMNHRANLRTSNMFLGGYMAYQINYCVPAHRMMPYLSRYYDAHAMLRWIREHKPEVMLTSSVELHELIEQEKLDVRCIYTDWAPGQELPGIDQQRENRAMAAVDLLNMQLCHNAFGIPEQPRIFTTPCVLRGTEGL